MKTIKEVITNEILNNFYDELKNDYDLQDDLKIFKLIINIINVDIANYEIAYEDENIDRFIAIYLNILKQHYIEILQRARFLKLSTDFLKDYDNWFLKEIHNEKDSFGYEGFNADGTFQNNTIQSERYINNPIIFAKEIKNYFGNIINIIKREIKEYCFWYY